MVSDTNLLSKENGNFNCQFADDGSPFKSKDDLDKNEDFDDDEDEDMDFNPFLKGTPSPEESSSFSSAIEELDGGVVDNTSMVQNCDAGNPENGVETVVMGGNLSSGEVCERKLEKTVQRNHKRKKSISMSQAEIDSSLEKETGISSRIDDEEDGTSNREQIGKSVIDLDDDSAICMRTRARYSLASLTLDELEAFLQESDDEDDLPNVDDEDEYKKFLSAVLQGGDEDCNVTQEQANSDEDTDADFEIELEEALESDDEESTRVNGNTCEIGRAGRRPQTRQNKRQKTSSQCNKKPLDQLQWPLRPLVPILPKGLVPPIPTLDRRTVIAPTAIQGEVKGSTSGFNPHQIGQLYSLIHEHVQLLVQTYSLCVLDTSRQHIASQVQELISEMLHKHGEATACRGEPYPDFCFRPPYVCSSVYNEVCQVSAARNMSGSSTRSDEEGNCPPRVQTSIAQNASSSGGSHAQNSTEQSGSYPAVGSWSPCVRGPVLSVVDVAPLNLVESYMEDVCHAVREHRRRQVELSCATLDEREPLFPVVHFPSPEEASPSQQQCKKTLATTLVETSKKQSVALVPKEIAKLAARFFPLFNPYLFPHKPPSAAAANRVLFTATEDELLALGLMEYNTDWKAIKKRFLPCKSEHQIFIRQKNRCSSKAEENPIKAVRRLKTSPLTAEEVACIQEGLKTFKHDWMAIRKFVVPYRDPSLLPRQWRTALGTQRSYKQSEAVKEKRRLYERNRRKCKAVKEKWQLASDKEDHHAEINGRKHCSGDENADTVGESYVHEAFLADWRPDSVPYREGTDARQRPHNYVTGEAQINSTNRFPYWYHSQQPTTHSSNGIWSTSSAMSAASKPQIYLRPYKSRRRKNEHCVKLAPDLPPVNLPPSVRVLSQSEYTRNRLQSTEPSIGVSGSGKQNTGLRATWHVDSGAVHSKTVHGDKTRFLKDAVNNSLQNESGLVKENHVAEVRDPDSDLHMHPLLFMPSEQGRVTYYSPNSTAGLSSSFSFFSENRPQLNLSLCHNPNQFESSFSEVTKTNEGNEASGSIHFHPLLQRVNNVLPNLNAACSNVHPSPELGGISSQPPSLSQAAVDDERATCGSLAVNSNLHGTDKRTNGVDLEIHLSSTSSNDKNFGRNIGGKFPTGIMETRNIYSSFHQFGEKESFAQCNDISISKSDDIGDRSNLGIVMEQEELSDSDDDIEENVEFECEEMTDSEGDEDSDSDDIADTRDKELASAVVYEDYDDVQREGTALSHFKVNLQQERPPSLRLFLADSWLSLDSRGPTSPLSKKAEDNKTNDEIGSTKTSFESTSRPSRSCKKITPRRKIADMGQQLSLGLAEATTAKKPRKCKKQLQI